MSESGYWGDGFSSAVAHWWIPGEAKDRSLCGMEQRPIDIYAPWGRPRCKRCVKRLVAMQEGDSK